LYLWHWPLLVFTLVLTGQDSVGLLGGLAVIGVAIGLSFASTHVVERPIRSISLKGRRAWSVPLLLTALVVPVAATGYAVATVSSRVVPIDTVLDAEVYPGASVAGPGGTSLTAANTEEPAPGIASAPDDIPEVYAQGCHQEQTIDAVAVCEYGDPDSGRTMILTGGSHSAHWQPALELVAEQTGWHLMSATKSGCRPGTNLVSPDSEDVSINRDPAATDEQRLSCRAWNEASEQWIIEQDPDLVVLTSTVGVAEDETVPTAYLRLWEELDEHSIEVLAIRDTPRPGRDIPDCLAAEGPPTRECDTVRADVILPASATDTLPEGPNNVTFADLSDYLCDPDVCPPVIGNVVVYSDEDHMTRSYSRSLGDALLEVAPVLR
ncbi:MAG: SGNH hydrolase domain-containing protein, partial [Ornithinimicrobium sp.]